MFIFDEPLALLELRLTAAILRGGLNGAVFGDTPELTVGCVVFIPCDKGLVVSRLVRTSEIGRARVKKCPMSCVGRREIGCRFRSVFSGMPIR